MKIALTVDPEIPVPPRHYGGIERIVDMLVRGLLKKGHDITLFAHPDSDVPCQLVPYPALQSQPKRDLLRNMCCVSSNVIKGRYDLVHSFARLAYLSPLLPMKIPKIMSYQRPITHRSVVWGERLSRHTLYFTALSRYIGKRYEKKTNFSVIYNGVQMSKFTFQPKVSEDAPLLFLGRVEWIKGPHLAIEVASRCSRKLIIAGNIPLGEKHQIYFKEYIKPHLDGDWIQYVGPVDDAQKDKLLGSACAMLMLILWDEPFGIVMAEALACGTPVIGLRRGAIPEIVQDGVNGFVCENVEETVLAVNRIGQIDRKKCRQVAEEKFSDSAIVDAYEKRYLKIISDQRLVKKS